MGDRRTSLKKLSKLIYLTIPRGPLLQSLPPVTLSSPLQSSDVAISGMTCDGAHVHSGLRPVVDFFQYIRPCFYPSNVTSRTPDLGYFIMYLTNELTQHVGQALLRQKAFSSIFSPSETNDATTQPSFLANSRDSLILSVSFHEATTRYLAGVLCAICLECLFSKSQHMAQCSSYSLRALCSIEPSLGDAIIPFLMSSLHPDAVNQSHMAPSSINAIANICKPLLFPRPVLLPHLEELFTLTLPGIDANDMRKTMTTLNMYIMLLGWMPRAFVNYENVDQEGCSSMVEYNFPGNDYVAIAAGEGVASSEFINHFRDFRSTLSPIIERWIPLFVEKLFSLLKVKEQVKNSDGKTPASPLGPYIGEAFDIALGILGSQGRLDAAKQVIDFALEGSNATAANTAAKELAKMLEGLTGHDDCDGTIIKLLLDRLAEREGMDPLSASSENLSMRLRLIGGCFRQANSKNISLVADKVMFCFGDEYKHHSDKSVREAVAKLLKDVLRGLTSFYPVDKDHHNETLRKFTIVGCPQYSASDRVVDWHEPSEVGVATVSQLVDANIISCMTEIEVLIEDAAGKSCDESADLSIKLKEERLLTLLDLLQHGIRGAAEVLGDGENDSRLPRLGTGRENALSSFPAEFSMLLRGLRESVVGFLNRIHTALGIASTDSGPDDGSTNVNNLASAQSTTSLVSVVSNNPKVRELCMKIFDIIISHRMGAVKNINSIKKWHKATRRSRKSALSLYMEKKLSLLSYNLSGGNFTMDPKANEVDISSVEYWIGHDLTARSVAESAFLQHVIRQKELSFSATRAAIATNGGDSSNVLVMALQNLVELNGHEYDAVRSSAYGVFSSVSQRFGRGIEVIIAPLIETIQKPGMKFSVVSGALNIFHVDLMMKRITGNCGLCLSFLGALRKFPYVLLAIDEPDKRERLSNKISAVFNKYLMFWHHSPLSEHDAVRNKIVDLMQGILSDFGVEATTADGSENKNNGNLSGEGGGLRHEMYLITSIIHFIGHEDIQPVMPTTVWGWLMSTLRTKVGTPMMRLALGALTKLCLVQRSSLSCDVAPQVPNLLAETFSSVSGEDQREGSPAVQFLHGVSHGHESGTGRSAQWSTGVDQMLQNGEYLRNVIPRQDSCSADNGTFSKKFHVNNAGFIMNAVALALENNISISLDMIVKSLLEASALVPASNDDENRSVNATRAELFAALCRLLVGLEVKNNPAPAERAGIDKSWMLINDFLVQNISKISLDYCKDWAEALAYGLGEYPQPIIDHDAGVVNPVCSSIIDLASQAICDSQTVEIDSASSLDNDNNTNSTKQGFSKHTKHILLLIALLVADVGAVANVPLSRYYHETKTNIRTNIDDLEVMKIKSSYPSKSQVADCVMKILLNLPTQNCSVFSSPYVLMRQQLSRVLNILTTTDTGVNQNLSALCERVIRDSAKPIADSPKQDMVLASSSTSESSTITTTTNTGEVNQDIVSVSASVTVTNDVWKNSCDSAALWLCGLAENKESWRYIDVVEPLLSVILEGCSHSDITFSKQCHSSCVHYSRLVKVGSRSERDLLSRVLSVFSKAGDHTSLHVRETVMICLTLLLFGNQVSMMNSEKKLCKDVFAKGLLDEKPEVQVLSRKGMVAYLRTKPIDDLTALASSYIKNCDILASREKKKRKQLKQSNPSTSTTSEKPDDIYVTTIAMSSCMVLAFPYDLPEYVPNLLTALVRHVSHPAMREIITKTVQDFKSTHLDRWEDEFKHRFTREQLEDIQGAGAAHYFS